MHGCLMGQPLFSLHGHPSSIVCFSCYRTVENLQNFLWPQQDVGSCIFLLLIGWIQFHSVRYGLVWVVTPCLRCLRCTSLTLSCKQLLAGSSASTSSFTGVSSELWNSVVLSIASRGLWSVSTVTSRPNRYLSNLNRLHTCTISRSYFSIWA